MDDGQIKQTNGFRAWINKIEPYFPVLVAVFYLLCNKDFCGPTFDTDEFGYLSKMIFLSGKGIIYPSHWRFGFSLLLLPVAWLTQDQTQFWLHFVFFQSLIWCAVFYMLRSFISFVKKDISPGYRLFILLFCALYPSWCVMTGMAFTTTIFVFIYMLVITLICRWNGSSFLEPLIAAALSGFLYWIHPLALAIYIPLLIVFAVNARAGWKRMLLQLVIMTGILVIFCGLFKVITGAINRGMTDGASPVIEYTMDLMRHPLNIFVIAGILVTHLSTIVLTTMGIAFLGFAASIHQVLGRIFKKIGMPFEDRVTGVACFSFLSVGAVVTISALFFYFAHFDLEYYHWFYCRYAEPLILPLIVLGILGPWKKIYFVPACLTILAPYLGLRFVTTQIADHKVNNLSCVTKNIIEFFQLVELPAKELAVIHLVSAFVVIILIGLVAHWKACRRVILVLLILCEIIGIYQGILWHQTDSARKTDIYYQFVAGMEKSGIKRRVNWDSFLHRHGKHINHFEWGHFGIPRFAFWKSRWRFNTTEDWLKLKKGGILITDYIQPVLEHPELFIYKAKCNPGKYIVTPVEFPNCKDMQMDPFWKKDKRIFEKDFLFHYNYLLDQYYSEPLHTGIGFTSAPDVKYLHVKLSEPGSGAFFLNGKRLVPLSKTHSPWQVFDISNAVRRCNSLVYYSAFPGNVLCVPIFKITEAMVSDNADCPPVAEIPPMPLDQMFRFSLTPCPHLISTGFNGREPDGRWSSNYSMIEFQPAEVPANGLTVKIQMTPYLRPQPMIVRTQDGSIIDVFLINRTLTPSIELPRSYFDRFGKRVALSFEFPAAVQTYLRLLSCYFRNITLTSYQCPELASGAAVKFASDNAFCRNGFALPESWGIWSNARNCRIAFLLPENRKSETVRLRFKCHAFAKMHSVRIYFHGQPAGSWKISRPDAQFYDLKLTVPLSRRDVELRFEQFDLASPHELDPANMDRRTLGLGFISMQYLPEAD